MTQRKKMPMHRPQQRIVQIIPGTGWVAKFKEENGDESMPLIAWALVSGHLPVETFGDTAVVDLVAADAVVVPADSFLTFDAYVYGERLEDLTLETD